MIVQGACSLCRGSADAVTADYHSKSYWEERYDPTPAKGQAPYEWYASFEEIKPLVVDILKDIHIEKARILLSGCGNSLLGEDLVKSGESSGITLKSRSQGISTNFFRNRKECGRSRLQCQCRSDNEETRSRCSFRRQTLLLRGTPLTRFYLPAKPYIKNVLF